MLSSLSLISLAIIQALEEKTGNDSKYEKKATKVDKDCLVAQRFIYDGTSEKT